VQISTGALDAHAGVRFRENGSLGNGPARGTGELLRQDPSPSSNGVRPAAIATSSGSQAQKLLAVVVVGAMFCTLFLTRYMMPILHSGLPNPLGSGACEDDHLVEGINSSRHFIHLFPEEEGAIPNSRPHGQDGQDEGRHGH
jgi:hypothetical protein